MNAEAVKTKRQELKDLERAMAELPYTAGDTARADLQAQWQQKHQEFLSLLKEDVRNRVATDTEPVEDAGVESEEETASAPKTKNKTKTKNKG